MALDHQRTEAKEPVGLSRQELESRLAAANSRLVLRDPNLPVEGDLFDKAGAHIRAHS